MANPGGETYFFPVSIVKAITGDFFLSIFLSASWYNYCPPGKAYLGGYRNKITGQKYHHASSQTPVDQTKAQNKSRKIASDAEKLRSRQTQTTETKTLSIQVRIVNLLKLISLSVVIVIVKQYFSPTGKAERKWSAKIWLSTQKETL